MTAAKLGDWAKVAAVVVVMAMALLSFAQAHGGLSNATETIRADVAKLDERKADKALVDEMLAQNRREHDDIKRLLGDISAILRGRSR